MSEPLIAVCLLAHNSASFIATAIESVLAQSFSDWEMLISDDASSDNTGQIARAYLSDRRIRYIHHQNNLRQGGNWGFAIENTRAPFIATLHADDVWEPHTLRSYMSAFAENQEMDLVWGNWLRTTESLYPMAHQPPKNDDRTYTGLQALARLLLTNPILPSAAAFRRQTAAEAGAPSRDYGMLCDRDWFLRLAKKSRICRSLSAQLLKYRVHATSVTNEFTANGKLLEELDAFVGSVPEMISVLQDGMEVKSVYEKSLAEFYFRAAIGLRVARQGDEAEKRMRQALSLNANVVLRPALFIKWLLFYAGPPGTWILTKRNGRNMWVTSPTSIANAKWAAG